MSIIRKIKLAGVLGLLLAIGADNALASKAKNQMFASNDSDAAPKRSSIQNMMFDLQLNYVRDTSPAGTSDTAGKFSLGGMFNYWLGLDLQGLYRVKTKDFLVGTDLRVAPTDWLFFKGGIGGYSDKSTNQFKLTPLAGAGIIAHIDHDFYFVAETSYFQVNSNNNIGLGAGAGLTF